MGQRHVSPGYSSVPTLVLVLIFLNVAGCQTRTTGYASKTSTTSRNTLHSIRNIPLSVALTISNETSASVVLRNATQTKISLASRSEEDTPANIMTEGEATISEESMASVTDATIITHTSTGGFFRAGDKISTPLLNVPEMASPLLKVISTQPLMSIETTGNTQHNRIPTSLDPRANPETTASVNSSSVSGKGIVSTAASRNSDETAISIAFTITTEGSVVTERFSAMASGTPSATIPSEVERSTFTASTTSTDVPTSNSTRRGDETSTSMYHNRNIAPCTTTEIPISTLQGRSTETTSASTSTSAEFSGSSTQMFSPIAKSTTTQTSIPIISVTMEASTTLDFTNGSESSNLSSFGNEVSAPLSGITSTKATSLKAHSVIFVTGTMVPKATSDVDISIIVDSTGNPEVTNPVVSNNVSDLSIPVASGKKAATSLHITTITTFGNFSPATTLPTGVENSTPLPTGSNAETFVLEVNIPAGRNTTTEKSGSETVATEPRTIAEIADFVSSRSGSVASRPSTDYVATEALISVASATTVASKRDVRTSLPVVSIINTVPAATTNVDVSSPFTSSHTSSGISLFADSIVQTSFSDTIITDAVSGPLKKATSSLIASTGTQPTITIAIVGKVAGIAPEPITNIMSGATSPGTMLQTTPVNFFTAYGSSGFSSWAIILICLATVFALLILLSFALLIFRPSCQRLMYPNNYFTQHIMWVSDRGIELESGIENHGRSDV